jgi:subtilisin family serine protease
MKLILQFILIILFIAPVFGQQKSKEQLFDSKGIDNVFIHRAVTPQEMAERANYYPYVKGEIVVAIELQNSKTLAMAQVREYEWSQLFGSSEVKPLAYLMTKELQPNQSFSLVHLSLPDNLNVFEAMNLLDGQDDVLWSSPNFYFEGDPREIVPNDPSYGLQYHHPLMQNDLAWDITYGSSNIMLGITDDGVETTHSDLTTNIWVNPGEIPGNGIDDDNNGYIDDVNGWDFSSGNNNPNPNSTSYDHGTHVSGICAGRTNNSTGIAGVSGHSTILPIQFYGGGGSWTAAVCTASFTYAADNGANIVNTSYNINGFVGDPVFTAGMQYMHDAGVLHFNSGGNASELNPARQAFHQTLLVVSTDASDIISSFSNYGTGMDISAPGSSIYSTVTSNGYGYKSGTSMATPNAAGAAALIWSANPTWTSYQVAAQLLATADDIDPGNPAYAGLLGSGRVNTYSGLTTVIGAPIVKSLEGMPIEGSVVHPSAVTDFTVSFSQVMDPATVNNIANFELSGAGPDNIFGNGDDVFYTISTTTTYQLGTNQMNFVITGPAFITGLHRLRLISGGLSNPHGTALDGDENGTGGDDFIRNFTISYDIFCQEVEIEIYTDDYGYETTWELVDDASGTVLLSGGSYDDFTTYTETICLERKCYTFTIYDSYGDGICCSYGNGYYTVTNLTISEVYGSGGDFNSEESVPFCITAPGFWTGNTSTDWNVATNWDDSNIPAASSDVTIPISPDGGNYPETNTGAGAECNDLTIEAGAHLYIPANNTLTVNGSLTNNSGDNGLVVESSASGTASLIHNSSSVNGTVERYLTDGMWHFIGIPVNNAEAGVFHLSSGHSDIYLRTHDEATNTWDPYIVPIVTPLLLGRGYETWVGDPAGFTQPETIAFKGAINSGDFTTGSGGFYGLQYTPSHGLNLISNPYPSALIADIDNWSKNNVDNSVWIWDDASGNYVYWNGTDHTNTGGWGTMSGGIIPAMQGFFVLANNSSPYLTIPQSDRTHSSQAFYKDSFVPSNTLKLNVTGNDYEDVVFVSFNEQATDGYDGQYDVKKIYGLNVAPQLYSIIPGDILSINSLSELTEYRMINLGFECEVPATFTITASELESFEGYMVVYIEDLKNGTLHNLSTDPTYTFVHETGEDPNRFILHFGEPNAVNAFGLQNIRIYSNLNNVYVQKPAGVNGEIAVFDMMGQEILRQKTGFESLEQVSVNHGPGYYLVQFQSEESFIAEKVFIK